MEKTGCKNPSPPAAEFKESSDPLKDRRAAAFFFFIFFPDLFQQAARKFPQLRRRRGKRPGSTVFQRRPLKRGNLRRHRRSKLPHLIHSPIALRKADVKRTVHAGYILYFSRVCAAVPPKSTSEVFGTDGAGEVPSNPKSFSTLAVSRFSIVSITRISLSTSMVSVVYSSAS